MDRDVPINCFIILLYDFNLTYLRIRQIVSLRKPFEFNDEDVCKSDKNWVSRSINIYKPPSDSIKLVQHKTISNGVCLTQYT